MRTIAVLNQKGGCGKTITAINLSGFLAQERRRVLLVDLDPQGHATLGLSTDAVEPARTVYDVLVHENGGPKTCLHDIRRSVVANLDVAPANVRLSAAPEKLAAVVGRENILAEALDEVRKEYDYVVIDCPPNIGLLTFNALKACSEAIVPMDPSFFSLHGLGKLLETVELLARKTGHVVVARVLVTLYSGRTQFARDVVDEVHRHLAGRYYTTMIRYSVKLAEAASHGLPIANYCKHCVGYDDYRALAAEVMELEGEVRAIEGAAGDEVAAPGGAPDSASVPAAPRPTPEGVVFTIEAPDAGRVQLVGDFNEWALDDTEMKPSGRVWKKVLKLQPGRYQYRYVVDGCWQNDPLNASVEPAPFGGHNSVLVLNDGCAT
jgi:chromosome partitioning protein